MRSYTVGFVPPPQIWDLSELHQTALQVDDDHGAQHGLLKQRARDRLSQSIHSMSEAQGGVHTFGRGSSRNPIANVTIITMTADSKPATWKRQKRQRIEKQTCDGNQILSVLI